MPATRSWSALLCREDKNTRHPERSRLPRPGHMAAGRSQPPAFGIICSTPPPLLTLIDRDAAGSVGISTCCGPPSLSAVSAYGPPGTDRIAGPPSLRTGSGPSARVACTGPPPESRFAAPVPETDTGPPAVATRTETRAGTVTVNATPHPETAHAGASRVRRPAETVPVTVGGGPLFGLNVIASMILT